MSEGRLADRAYTEIVRIINDQGMVSGDRLPSEARLADLFGMSRTIVREALARLASDGITEARRGAGSYVKRRPSDRLGSHMPMDALAATLGTYEVRFVLEAEAARLAAQRRSHHQLEAIERALSALRAALLSNAPAHDEDWNLHRSIAEATGNAAFPPVFDHLREAVMQILRAGVEISRARPPEVIGAMMDEHDAIVDAIRARDADGAALAMRWHLSQGRKRLMP
ncbi:MULTISPECIES: FadR/GntR family transcriptional regulator [Sphingomonas]|uniref:FadR/GntR family transcriptional regulator n=1 Tax=Sphingomonas TaxID=13687 RepID=UPI000F7EABC7|nr:FCD domain-containing protein [Sphingomonas sp. ABOLF]RSV17455.1 FadR family transcriptional regulator [Sphingomonas sp. ABOLF]GLK19947.1 GntR family transcriptional regulator [Microbacterium terregens]